MAALNNPRYERFAQCIVAGLAGRTRLEQAQSAAYRAAGFLAKDGNSAEAAASRLLRRVKPILDRVRELQEHEARRRNVTLDSIVDELEEAREVARANDQGNAMVAATATKAKILGLSVERIEQGKPGDFSASTSTDELADMLIRQANPGIRDIDQGMREGVLAELARHARAIQALATGDPA